MEYLGTVKPLPPVTGSTDGNIYIASDPQDNSVRLGIAPVRPGGTVVFPQMIGPLDLIPRFQATSPFESETGTVNGGRRAYRIAPETGEGDYYFGTSVQSYPYRIAVRNQGADSAAFVLSSEQVLQGRLALTLASSENPLVSLCVNAEGLAEEITLTVCQKVRLPAGQSSGLLSLGNMPAGASFTVCIESPAYTSPIGGNIEVLGGEELDIEIEPPPAGG